MDEQSLFNGLIGTYRELNMNIRPLPEERLGRGRQSVRRVIVDMRDDELRFSQALKERLVGAPMADIFRGRVEVEGAEIPSPDDTAVEVISQFGTARESTLAMLRGMSPDAWDDQSQGGFTIREAIGGLLANDAAHLKRIVTLLGSPAVS
jgi:hypothetical protein